ncbi:hypothetical protein L873DRAFT_1813262 [Choiromyces venosus 120613-1]|uniref:Uncharacterized protein n=1 Tax=Choiromyces venosus 120613-1 TaxID=1336337 RepID=A0A3N4JA73_9PEZI|nr:hypothetical protein L873DRAFT_1813262 [Choiromyces venosus 120613-1]
MTGSDVKHDDGGERSRRPSDFLTQAFVPNLAESVTLIVNQLSPKKKEKKSPF